MSHLLSEIVVSYKAKQHKTFQINILKNNVGEGANSSLITVRLDWNFNC